MLLLAPELYGPLRQVGQQFHASADGTAAAERIFAVLDRPAAILHSSLAPAVSARARGARPSPPDADPALEAIRLHGVGYEYPDRPGSALDGVDLELAPGEITALVGPSGAGKSTIARLLMRLADPTRGRVTCGGVDLRDLDLERWREQIAWVPQRPQLFAGTVAENIRLGAPHADAARASSRRPSAAGAVEFIRRLPQGLDTPIGEGARRLSAGQRQRIALARAFLRDAPSARARRADRAPRRDERARDRRCARPAGARAHDAADRPPPGARRARRPRAELDAGRLRRDACAPGSVDAGAGGSRMSQQTPGGHRRRRACRCAPSGDCAAASAAGCCCRSRSPPAQSPPRSRCSATSGYLISRAAQRPEILALTVAIVAVRAFGSARAALRYGERLASHDLALRLLARLRARFYERLAPLVPGELAAATAAICSRASSATSTRSRISTCAR